jgi:UPF0755 protein
VRSGDYLFVKRCHPRCAAGAAIGGTALNRITVPEIKRLPRSRPSRTRRLGGADEFLCLARDPVFLAALDLPASGLEGYLFPDTYDFAWTTTPEDILRLMVQRFRQQAEALRPRLQASGLSEIEMITLASIIESETGAAAERAMISGAFSQPPAHRHAPGSDGDVRSRRRPTDGGRPEDRLAVPCITPDFHPGRLQPAWRRCRPHSSLPTCRISTVANSDRTHTFSRTLDEHNRAVAAGRRAMKQRQSAFIDVHGFRIQVASEPQAKLDVRTKAATFAAGGSHGRRSTSVLSARPQGIHRACHQDAFELSADQESALPEVPAHHSDSITTAASCLIGEAGAGAAG